MNQPMTPTVPAFSTEAAHVIAAAVREEVRAQLGELVADLDTRSQAAAERIERAAVKHASTYAATAEAVGAELVQRVERAVQATAQAAAEAQARAAEVARGQIEAAAARGAEAIDGAATRGSASLASAAAEAIERATQSAAEAERATAAAERAKDRAAAEREKAERATAMLALAGDIEVQRMYEELRLNEREKAIMTELKADRARISDGFDLKAKAIQRGVLAYYPELNAKLDSLVDEAERRAHDGAA